MNQPILYFIAAVLFITAAAISTARGGISVKTGFGVLMAASMVWLGMKSKGASGSP